MNKQEQTIEERFDNEVATGEILDETGETDISIEIMDFIKKEIQQARQEAFIAGRTVENYKGEWQEVYNDSHTSAKYETFEDYIKAINRT